MAVTIAITVFVIAYVLIASDRVSKTLVALCGAAIVLAVGVVESDDAFFSHETGIDWDVIFLLFGMMIIVGVLRQTGVFEYIAIWSAKRANGSPVRIMILLVLVTAVASAMLDNVTTMLLIAPVTLLVCERLADQPDPIPHRRGVRLQHRRCVDVGRRPAQHHHRQPGRPDVQRLSRSHDADRHHRHDRFHRDAAASCSAARSVSTPNALPMSCRSNEREAIRDPALLVKCAIVLVLVFAAFILHSLLHIAPSVVALIGAGVLILISGLEQRRLSRQRRMGDAAVLRGLFVMVGALVKTGVVDELARLPPT